MKFGPYLKSLRVSAGLMQRELAGRVGISASMLSLLESGKREPTIKLLKDLARALDVPTGVMLVVALAEGDERAAPKELRELTDALASATTRLVAARRRERNAV